MSLLNQKTIHEERFWSRPAMLRRLLRFAGDGPDAWLEEQREAVGCGRPGCAGARANAGNADVVPSYDGREYCSLACLQEVVASDVRRKFKQSNTPADVYQHRMPLGLLMLSRKWITHEQLTAALRRQRREGFGRIGEWLVEMGASDELAVARAVAAQWGVAMLSSEEQTAEATGLLPTLLIEAFGIVPVRVTTGRLFYVAVDDQVQRSLLMAIEKMTGLSVEPVVMAARVFQRLQQQALAAAHPPLRLFRSDSVAGLLQTLESILAERPTLQVRLTWMREYFWLRLERAMPPGSNRHEPATRALEDCILICARRRSFSDENPS